MAQEKPNRIVEWYLAFREWLPEGRSQAKEWAREVYQRPALIWETLALRCAILSAGGLLLLLVVKIGASKLAPPPPDDAQPVATEAYFHVLCSDPSCGHHFMIYRKKGFDDFPVECPKCRRKTGEAARQCYSATCQGRWIIASRQGERWVCPVCQEAL